MWKLSAFKDTFFTHACRLYSNEMAKLSTFYNSIQTRRRLGHFQIILNLYAIVCIFRFAAVIFCQAFGTIEVYYQFDLLLSIVNFRRNLNEYVHLCFAAFAGYTVYIYYLNYYALTPEVALEINGIIKKKIKRLKDKRKKGKSAKGFTERFLKYESIFLFVLYSFYCKFVFIV